MTIAAGFVHREGVLLCADSQQETGPMKTQAPKLGSFECSGGHVAYALAGHVAFAESAISKCRRALKAKAAGGTFNKLEEVLDNEYRRVVFKHPQYPADWTLHYWLLLAIQSPEQGVSLYVTHENTIRPVNTGFECIGVGQYLGHYLIGGSYVPNMREQDILVLAAYMLNRVDDHVPGCGGPCQFVAMHNDGSVSPVESTMLNAIEEKAREYESHARALLFQAVTSESTHEQFGDHIRVLEAHLLKVKSSPEASQFRGSFNGLLGRLFPGVVQYPESTTADQSPLLPSPELPEGSGES